jgi:pimeloyl-ACP methyl ester carboxylesterase
MLPWIVLSSVVAALTGYVGLATMIFLRMTRARRRYPDAEPSALGLTYEDIWFRSRQDELAIAGWYLPAQHASRAIILAHGVGGCRGHEFTASSIPLVAHLVEHGFSVLMIDLRGHGESTHARMTWGINERRDVLGAVDWLLARGYAPGSIGILGLSMGGVAGIGAALDEPAIGALMIDSACADFLPMMRKHFRRQAKLPTFFLPSVLLFGGVFTGVYLAKLRPANLLRKVSSRPVLVVHARGDKMVPSEHAQQLAKAGNGELWLTESNKHLGSFAHDPLAYAQRVVTFFAQSLGKPKEQALPGSLLESAVAHGLWRMREVVLAKNRSGGR